MSFSVCHIAGSREASFSNNSAVAEMTSQSCLIGIFGVKCRVPHSFSHLWYWECHRKSYRQSPILSKARFCGSHFFVADKMDL